MSADLDPTAAHTTTALAALAVVWPKVEFDTYNDGVIFAALTDRGEDGDEGSDPTISLVWDEGDDEDPALCWGVLDHNDGVIRLGLAVDAMRAAMRYESEFLDAEADDPDAKLGYQREDAAELRRLARVGEVSDVG